jgi:hypothetical protein
LSALFKSGDPFGVPAFAFPPTLVTQATPEQKEFWSKRVDNLEIFVTYAQVRSVKIPFLHFYRRH